MVGVSHTRLAHSRTPSARTRINKYVFFSYNCDATHRTYGFFTLSYDILRYVICKRTLLSRVSRIFRLERAFIAQRNIETKWRRKSCNIRCCVNFVRRLSARVAQPEHRFDRETNGSVACSSYIHACAFDVYTMIAESKANIRRQLESTKIVCQWQFRRIITGWIIAELRKYVNIKPIDETDTVIASAPVTHTC